MQVEGKPEKKDFKRIISFYTWASLHQDLLWSFLRRALRDGWILLLLMIEFVAWKFC